MDAIVIAAGAFAAAFTGAWMFSPSLRGWIERPKFRFQANVQSYDQARRQAGKATRDQR
jgi:hypothetical protein